MLRSMKYPDSNSKIIHTSNSLDIRWQQKVVLVILETYGLRAVSCGSDEPNFLKYIFRRTNLNKPTNEDECISDIKERRKIRVWNTRQKPRYSVLAHLLTANCSLVVWKHSQSCHKRWLHMIWTPQQDI